MSREPTIGPYKWIKEDKETGKLGCIYYRLAPGILVTDLTDGTPWGDDIDQANARLLAASWEMREALRDLVSVIDAAGSLNLSNGVQLGQTAWYVKCEDALRYARALLTRIDGDPT